MHNNEIEVDNNQSFNPKVFQINGAYYAYRLHPDGFSIVPRFVNEQDIVLESFYQITIREKFEIKHYDGFDKVENRYFVKEVKLFINRQEIGQFTGLMREMEMSKSLENLINDYPTQSPKVLVFWFPYQDHKIPDLNIIVKRSKSNVYKIVEDALKHFYLSKSEDLDDSAYWQFTLTNFRKDFGLEKDSEVEIKNAFKKIGIHVEDRKKKFRCASGGYVYAIRYFISVGELRAIFDPTYSSIIQAEESDGGA